MAYPYPFKSKFAALLAGSALLSCLLAGPALANEVAKVKSMSFRPYSATSPIHVISTDGKTWNKLRSEKIEFSGKMNLNLRWPGFVDRVAVVLGSCGGDPCEVMPRVWDEGVGARDWSGTRNFSFDPSVIPLGDADSITPDSDAQDYIKECNKHLQPDGPTKGFSFNSLMHATFVTDTGISHAINLETEASSDGYFPNRIDHWRRASFGVNVVCHPILKATTSEITINQGEFKTRKIKLFLATFSGGGNDGPNPATTCPGLRVTTRVETSKAGGVDIRLWRQEGEAGAITSEFKSGWASYDAVKNGYFADFVHSEKFDATTWLQFMAEAVGDSFAPATQWKDIIVRCTSGGLSNGQPDSGDPIPPTPPQYDPQVDIDNVDLIPPVKPDPDGPKASWTGVVTLADSSAAKRACPRKGQVSFTVTRHDPGTFNYKIGCSNGQGFQGSVQSFGEAGADFEAHGAHVLNVTRTRTIQCTLQEVKSNGARVTIDKGSLAYTCSNPSVDPSADDIAVDPKPIPTHSGPDVSILCKAGFQLIGKECRRNPVITVPCADDERRINGKCIQIIIDCYKGFHQEGMKCVRNPVITVPCADDERRINGKCIRIIIDCLKGYRPVDGKCERKAEIVIQCKPNQHRVKGRCVPNVIIDCLRGFSLKNGRCVRNPVIVKPCAPSQSLIRGYCVPKRPVILKNIIKLDPPRAKRAIIPGRALRAKGAVR